MTYLGDTDTCSYIMKRSHPDLVARVMEFAPGELKVSAISAYELEYGARRSERYEPLARRIREPRAADATTTLACRSPQTGDLHVRSDRPTIRTPAERKIVMTKLTLSIDPDIAQRAKDQARSRGTSVSQLVEAFLRALPPVAARSPRARRS